MNREIKFRAWHTGAKIMYESPIIRFTLLGDFDGSFGVGNTFNQDCAVLMQYTGLKDKNGKDIYEGDILKSRSEIIRPFAPKGKQRTGRFQEKICAVEWRQSEGGYYLSNSRLPGIKQEHLSQWYEVIGNIYENPELLEVV